MEVTCVRKKIDLIINQSIRFYQLIMDDDDTVSDVISLMREVEGSEGPEGPAIKDIPMCVGTPEPEPLQLIIITCKTYMNCCLNLDLIAKKLVLDDQIIGKKLLGVVEEGFITSKNKAPKPEKSKNKRHIFRKDFSNQCTIVVKIDGIIKKLNLKIFGNGKIVITGGLSPDDGKKAVMILREKIRHLSGEYQIRNDIQFSDLFEGLSVYIKYINKNYIVFLKFFEILGINLDLRLDLLLNKKVVEKYEDLDAYKINTVCDPLKEGMIAGSTKDIEAYLRLIQVFNVCHLYFPNSTLLEKLESKDPLVYRIINDLYELKSVTLPLTFNMEQFNQDFSVTTENYNTMFSCGIQINREVFTQILNQKYKKPNLISSAKFEPSNYQGINVKYVSRIMCHPSCTSGGKKKCTKCLCKEISFLIFQEGKIIITGGRTWDQLIDGYNVITGILKTEYHDITVTKDPRSSASAQTANYPSHIIRTEADGITYTYINKKTQIQENPRNVFLLKKEGLLAKYLK